MTWWAWVVGGAILLGAELSLVNAQFYLVFVGGAAILTGLATLAWPDIEAWIQWAVFALLCAVSVLGLRRRIYENLRARSGEKTITEQAVGRTIELPVDLAPGASAQVEYRGSFWTVVNDGAHALPAGSRARIHAVQGLRLQVRGHE